MTAVATALSCIVYPSVYIITAAYLLLQLLVKVLVKVLGTVLVTPLLYLGNSILSLILLPLRILAKFEVRGIRAVAPYEVYMKRRFADVSCSQS